MRFRLELKVDRKGTSDIWWRRNANLLIDSLNDTITANIIAQNVFSQALKMVVLRNNIKKKIFCGYTFFVHMILLFQTII